MNNFFRGRRLRSSAIMREMVRETRLNAEQFIMPYFVVETEAKGVRKPINSMPCQAQLSLDELELQVDKAVDMGLRSLMLFGIPKSKDPHGSAAYAENGIIQKAFRMLKKKHGKNLVLVGDVCLCEYTSHGHCGLLDDCGRVLNDESLEILARVALSQAHAGADIIAPSDMMDGRVGAIRKTLDDAGFCEMPIMSYSAKYASSFYGPFREAAESAPKFGDRKSYQMDPANWREALREAEADVLEGADMLMVKPALAYLDMIARLRECFALPLVAYQVSGEYSMIKAAGANGWINEEAVAYESLLGIRRAGADLIISYFTEDLLSGKLA